MKSGKLVTQADPLMSVSDTGDSCFVANMFFFSLGRIISKSESKLVMEYEHDKMCLLIEITFIGHVQ